jgi:O-antigen ligase
LGHGFHQTVTYQSSDPRIKNAANPQGWLTTDTFELAYLDMLLKFGIIGLASFLAALLFLLFSLGKNYFSNPCSIQVLPWLILALLITHSFTPYLNHPLGIGLVLTATLAVNKLKMQENQAFCG